MLGVGVGVAADGVGVAFGVGVDCVALGVAWDGVSCAGERLHAVQPTASTMASTVAMMMAVLFLLPFNLFLLHAVGVHAWCFFTEPILSKHTVATLPPHGMDTHPSD